MKALCTNFRGYYPQLILGPLFKLLEAVLELMVPLLMANIIDVGIAGGDRAYVLRQGLFLLLLAVLGVAAATTCQYFASVAAFGFGASLRRQVFRHILSLSGHETDAIGAGSLITHITNDVNQVQNGVNMFIRLATRAPFLAIGSIVMAFVLNARIALIFLISTPLIVLVLYQVIKRTLPDYARIQQRQETLGTLTGQNLEGARVIRAFSRQESEKKDFAAASDAHSALTIQVGRISAALNPLTYVIANFAILAILWYGARFADRGLILSGDVFAMVNYMTQTLLALIVLANLIVQFTRAAASAKRLSALLATESSIRGESVPHTREQSAFLAFEQVDFSYAGPAGKNALEGVSFTAEQGQTIGVIGGTGCGKTTLANLILRFYDVTGGRILLDGQDLRSYPLEALREKIGYVPQNVKLFSGTIRSNLQLGAPQADDDALWAALTTAQARDFVQQKPEGLDTPVEKKKKNFSGGQRQRLTIARALAKRPSLLILDDSSSALDFATDAALRRALKQDTGGMTVLLISQRASAVKDADRILVMDEGRLVGQGSHEELLQTCPVYREICVSQKLVPQANPESEVSAR